MVPSGWSRTTLENLVITITSGSRDWARFYSETGAKFIRMTNLTRNGIHLNLDKLKFVDVQSDSADGKRTQLQYGDILLSITAELGKIGWVPDDLGEAYINQHTALIRVNQALANHKFIAYLLSSRKMNYIINSFNDAGAKAGLNLTTIKKIPIISPPTEEQTKIAQILSTWDKAIETVERLIENSRAQKKGLMQGLLASDKRIPGFDDEWEEVPIKDMGKIVAGGTPDTTNPEYWDGDIEWTTPTDITALKSRFISSTKRKITASGVGNSSAQLLPTGTILVCTRATIGYLAIASNPISTNQGFKSLIPNSKYDSDFIYYLFKHNRNLFIRYSCGSTFLELSKKDFSRLTFLVPKLEEQRRISQVLNAAGDSIRKLIEERDFLLSEKKALMQQLLTGKRRVKVGDKH